MRRDHVVGTLDDVEALLHVLPTHRVIKKMCIWGVRVSDIYKFNRRTKHTRSEMCITESSGTL